MKWNTQVVIIYDNTVALFTRAWIEIVAKQYDDFFTMVALFTRAWIEIAKVESTNFAPSGRPFHEGVD